MRELGQQKHFVGARLSADNAAMIFRALF